MNILFLTLLDFSSFSERNIYCDLLREFIRNGHEVYCISPTERRHNRPTQMLENGHLLKLRIGNTQKTNLIEKGLSTLAIEPMIVRAIRHYFSDVRFDLVLYSTPPITLCRAVRYVKERDNAKTYLLLKDIFPQNAVDIGMLSKTGLRSIIYRYFRRREKELYALSDRIGCMSQANCDYVIAQNPQVDPRKVEVCPNAIDIRDISATRDEIRYLRSKYGLPLDKKIFVYGGNLGKPQGMPHIISCLKAAQIVEDAFFLIVGNGTESGKLSAYINREHPNNLLFWNEMPKSEYDSMIAACDVGLIFLDYRFTIPNFPSRLLAYQQADLPVLACTDENTDIGSTVVNGGFGWWSPSNDPERFVDSIRNACVADLGEMRKKSKEYLRKHYSVEVPARIIGEFMNI